MKLSLVVQTAGTMEGKTLEIKLPQFVVGRDPQCQLRPASALISKRHCALLQRDGKAFIRDFDSTNGTFVNDQPVKGEIELHQGDQLKIGPLVFQVCIEISAPVNQRTPPPPTRNAPKTSTATAPTAIKPGTAKPTPLKASSGAKAEAPAREEVPGKPEAAPAAASSAGKGAQEEDDDIAAMLLSLHDDGTGTMASSSNVPDGSTVMDLVVPPGSTEGPRSGDKEKPKTPGNTSNAAKSILEKYMRRPRG